MQKNHIFASRKTLHVQIYASAKGQNGANMHKRIHWERIQVGQQNNKRFLEHIEATLMFIYWEINLLSHGFVRRIQRPISKNSILVPFMYAYCSNYPWLFVCDFPSIKIILQDVYPFSVLLYTSKLFFSSPCQSQCELLPSLGVRHLLTFHILIFSS